MLRLSTRSLLIETQAASKPHELHLSGHGGGWGSSAHSVEAIRFSADTDILLGGLGLFGGRGEYTAKIKVKFTIL